MDEFIRKALSWLQIRYRRGPAYGVPISVSIAPGEPNPAADDRRNVLIGAEFESYLLSIGAPFLPVLNHCISQGWIEPGFNGWPDSNIQGYPDLPTLPGSHPPGCHVEYEEIPGSRLFGEPQQRIKRFEINAAPLSLPTGELYRITAKVLNADLGLNTISNPIPEPLHDQALDEGSPLWTEQKMTVGRFASLTGLSRTAVNDRVRNKTLRVKHRSKRGQRTVYRFCLSDLEPENLEKYRRNLEKIRPNREK